MFSISQQRHTEYWTISGTMLGPGNIWINKTPSLLQEAHGLTAEGEFTDNPRRSYDSALWQN